ncbi:MAG: type II toxin-antitoxin system VapC family toxin [Acidimicrobiales bacterium]
MIILDTNVVSELMRPEPSAVVKHWLLARPGRELYTTAISLAEVLYGIEKLPDGRRKDLLRSTANDVFDAFEDHVLAFDVDAAEEYARLVDTRQRLGRPIDGFDAQIASICRTHLAPLATRNVKDFQQTGIDIIDPWKES